MIYSLSHAQLCNPWTIAFQVPVSMGFSGQESWNRLLFLFPEDLPNPEIKSMSPAWQADSSPLSHLGCPSSILGILKRSPCLKSLFPAWDSLALWSFWPVILSPPFVPTLLAIALADSPISTDMFSMSTSLIFHCGVLVPEAPEEASRYLWLLAWASNITTDSLSFLSCSCQTVLEIVNSLSAYFSVMKCLKWEVCHE